MLSAVSPPIHIFAGEKVCIHAIRPTQPSAAFASRHSRRIESALVITGVWTTRTGIALVPAQRGGDLAGVLGHPGERLRAVHLLAPGDEPDLEPVEGVHVRASSGRGIGTGGRTAKSQRSSSGGAAMPSSASARAASSGRTSLRKRPVAVSTLARIFVVDRLRWNGKNAEAQMPVAAVPGRLLRDHQVRALEGEERVVAKGDVTERVGEVELLGGSQVGQPRQPVTAGADRDLEGPAGRERDPDGKGLVRRDDPRRRALPVDELAAEAISLRRPVAAVRVDRGGGDRREVVEGVDLAVRVRERRAGLGAAVLEDHHELVSEGPPTALASDPSTGRAAGRARAGRASRSRCRVWTWRRPSRTVRARERSARPQEGTADRR